MQAISWLISNQSLCIPGLPAAIPFRCFEGKYQLQTASEGFNLTTILSQGLEKGPLGRVVEKDRVQSGLCKI